jgi:hypothetical protein
MLRPILVAAALLTASCSATNVVQVAMQGDLASLKQEIQASQANGELDRGTVRRLAWAVAGRELRSSRGETAVRRIRQVSPCAGDLVTVLRDRASRSDDAGAEASLLLLETHRMDGAPLVARYRDASSGAWRAVAARAATTPGYAQLRRTLIADHDERVRRAALRAALGSPHVDDLAAVLEATRLDPDPLSRSLAARAAGAIGGERVALALRDYWARADESTRMMIVEGWAMPATLDAGGRESLIWAAETERGLPALAAADALVRVGGASASVGEAVLFRALQEGTQQERRLAIRLAPLSDPELRSEIERALDDSDPLVRVMALARLVEDPGQRPTTIKKLRKLARGRGGVAVQARAALAAAGDTSVVEQLLQQLEKGSSHRRRVAAESLLRMGLYDRAATALADDDPAVRTAVACWVLRDTR